MTISRPDPLFPLTCDVISLRALTYDDFPDLFAAIGNPLVFTGGWGGGRAAYRSDYEEWVYFIRRYLPWGKGNIYAVCSKGEGGLTIGTTTLSNFDTEHGSVQLGWTAFAPRYWGSKVNPASKLLLLSTVFAHGFERVHIQVDAANTRSRAAIIRLGAQVEGVLRHTQRSADGAWRDTAVYSILREEWPSIEQKLHARVYGNNRR